MNEITSSQELQSSDESTLINSFLGPDGNIQLAVLSDVEMPSDKEKEEKFESNLTEENILLNNTNLEASISNSIPPVLCTASYSGSPSNSFTAPYDLSVNLNSSISTSSCLTVSSSSTSVIVPFSKATSTSSKYNPVISSPNSLPPKTDWPGSYSFNLYFPAQNVESKVIFSEQINKLYVAKGAPCPINFVVSGPVPPYTNIRTTTYYTQLHWAKDAVKRCLTHSMGDKAAGVEYYDRLIRVECHQAKYENLENGHQSVVFPFENPPIGQNFSTYIFKFTCFGSCTGGLNRRPIAMHFTLENNGVVLGRKILDVKICAGPLRDYRNDLKQNNLQHNENFSIPPKKRKSTDTKVEISRSIQEMVTFSSPLNKSDKVNSFKTHSSKNFTITVKDYSLYRWLRRMKRRYELSKALSNLPIPLHSKILEKLEDVDTTTTPESE